MKKPQRLRPGDKVAIVSLSRGMLGEEQFIHKYHLAKERLERDYGLRVVAMPNALKGIDYLYRHPEARAQDLMDAFRDPEIRAVFCAIGGDDTIRLLPYIDFEVLRNNPKIFTGFSDTTTNHFMMYKAGLVSYYGLSVMGDIAEYVEMNEYTRTAMEQTLFRPAAPLDIPCSDFYCDDTHKIYWKEEHMHLQRPRFPNTGYELLQGSGTVSGPLLGGCIDVFPEIVGTAVWPGLEEWRGKLLFLETSEDDPTPVTLSWFLRNLAAQGIFDVIRGILVGRPAMPDKYEPYKEIYRQVVGFEAGHPELPILYNVNVGHAYPIGLFGIGLEYEIDCERKTLTLLEPATV
ncbi:MAG: LD-carboxypeptidase [Oscillospiraceae bacterium]|nr:LD-carboxypeptidase [Oscillospiraceae bacterium]